MFIVWGDLIDVAAFSSNVTRMVRGFVFGNLVIGAVMGAVTIAVLYVVHLQDAALIGAVSGYLNLVPFVGVILAAILPMGAALFQYHPLSQVTLILFTVATLHMVAGNLLIPRVIGRRVSISPVAATVGILFWGWLWGLIGVLLAVPLTAFVKIVSDAHPSLDKIASLLAEHPPAAKLRPPANETSTAHDRGLSPLQNDASD